MNIFFFKTYFMFLIYSRDFESWDEKAIIKRAKDFATLSYDKTCKLELKF